MKIIIESSGHHFTIPLPIRLALNGITFRIFTRYIKQHHNFLLQERDLKAVKNELVNIKKVFGKFELVDVRSSDGSRFSIIL